MYSVLLVFSAFHLAWGHPTDIFPRDSRDGFLCFYYEFDDGGSWAGADDRDALGVGIFLSGTYSYGLGSMTQSLRESFSCEMGKLGQRLSDVDPHWCILIFFGRRFRFLFKGPFCKGYGQGPGHCCRG